MPLYPDLLSEDCTDITDWTDGDASTGVSEVDPAGQFRFDTNATANSYVTAERHRTIASPPNQFTIEIKTYFDAIGTYGNGDVAAVSYSTETWIFLAVFASDGLFITKATNYTEVGTNIVKCNASAAWQTWRFQVDKSSGEASATVEAFLDGVSQGTVDCDNQADFTGYNGQIGYKQLGTTNPDRISHVNYIKVATGLGIIYGPSTSEFLQLL
jgi:hypothetical protein